jgi:hypothetical protein
MARTLAHTVMRQREHARKLPRPSASRATPSQSGRGKVPNRTVTIHGFEDEEAEPIVQHGFRVGDIVMLKRRNEPDEPRFNPRFESHHVVMRIVRLDPTHAYVERIWPAPNDDAVFIHYDALDLADLVELGQLKLKLEELMKVIAEERSR